MESSRCLYDVLGVATTATNEDIRSAYRKLALKWHPDKIQQSGASAEECEEATIRFQEIGRAYEVLADPSERSWYDSHRSQILSSTSSAPSDFDFNPWPFFSPSVFTGYGDTGKGFFAVYGEFFTKLHEQELSFANSRGLRASLSPPAMGNFATAYSQVQKFYNHWLGFSTVKDFSWCDEFKVSLAPNRKLRRLMEEENKKSRSKARKEFNDAIRRLAAFVRKRDKRVLERQIEIQRQEKEKEEILKARRKKEKEEQRMKASLYEEAEWTKVEPDGPTVDGSEMDENIGSYEWGQAHSKINRSKQKNEDEFYCIVCSKSFKSNEQWKNHERSKKHLERVAILRESFEEEDKEFDAVSSSRMADDDELNEMEDTAESLCSSGTHLSSTIILDQADTVSSTAHDIENNRVERTSVDITQCNSKNFPEIPSNSESDDMDPDNEDDEDDSLFTMVNRYSSRQRQVAIKESDVCTETLGSENDSFAESGLVKGKGEHLSAISQKSREAESNVKFSENIMGSSVSGETFLIKEKAKHLKLGGETGHSSRKNESKGQVCDEEQQAANLNRHSNKVEDVMCEPLISAVAQSFETLAMNEMEPSDSVPELKEELMMSRKNAACINDAHKVGDKHNQENLSPQEKKVNNHSRIDLESRKRSASRRKSKGYVQSAVLSCETCGEHFDSRNQLFKHISATKHATLK